MPRGASVRTFYVHPADAGCRRPPRGSRRRRCGGERRDRAARARRRAGPARDIVLLNAGAALFVAGRRRRSRDGIPAPPRRSIAARATATLEQLLATSHRTERTGMSGGGRRARPRSSPRRRAASRCARDPRAGARSIAPPRRRRRRALRARRWRAPRSPDRDRRVQAPIAVAGHPARRLRPGGDRAPRTRAGAAAISVLTEPTFFDGALDHLRAVRAAVRRFRSCARTSSSTSISCSRRAPPAPTPCC